MWAALASERAEVRATAAEVRGGPVEPGAADGMVALGAKRVLPWW